MTKIVINDTGCGFSLSEAAGRYLAELKGVECFARSRQHQEDLERDDEDLVATVLKFGEAATPGQGYKLVVVEIPDDVDWEVEATDYGDERIVEKHDSWGPY